MSGAAIDEEEEELDHDKGFLPSDAKAAMLSSAGASLQPGGNDKLKVTKSFCQRRLHSQVRPSQSILPALALPQEPR